jgi:hypothetical protein
MITSIPDFKQTSIPSINTSGVYGGFNESTLYCPKWEYKSAHSFSKSIMATFEKPPSTKPFANSKLLFLFRQQE